MNFRRRFGISKSTLFMLFLFLASASQSGLAIAPSERFSAPDPSLYTLNDGESRTFPRVIDSPFGGNGHASSWDGRIYIVTRSGGRWQAQVLRPERITRTNDGISLNGAFSERVDFDLASNRIGPSGRQIRATINWLGIVPDVSAGQENPFPSNAAGDRREDGQFMTYKIRVLHTAEAVGNNPDFDNNDNDNLVYRRATIVVRNPNTRDAAIERVDVEDDGYLALVNSDGDNLRCIEPTVTIDGRLIVCQGHEDSPGDRIDRLVYSWNADPFEADGRHSNGWTPIRNFSRLYYEDRNEDVAGLPLHIRYPVARHPIREANGNAVPQGAEIRAAYPWISREGSELFYQAARRNRDNSGARRSAMTVVGAWTGWMLTHIDGPINDNRWRSSRLFFSSPGQYTAFWHPFRDVENLAIPYSIKGPGYSLFGSNSQDYGEVDFDNYLDGNYVLALEMNEVVGPDGRYVTNRTADTSGNFQVGELRNGAAFPFEFNGQDRIVGRVGQGIHFRDNSHVFVALDENRFNAIRDGVTVDFWLNLESSNGETILFRFGDGALDVLLNGSRQLRLMLRNEQGESWRVRSDSVPTNQWVHIAMTYDPQSGVAQIFRNGELAVQETNADFGRIAGGREVRVGAVGSNARMILDEVKVSDLVRPAHAIAHNAYRGVKTPVSNAIIGQVPSHLQSLNRHATNLPGFSQEAAQLGELLFNDTLLSQTQNTACSTCHVPDLSFADNNVVAISGEPGGVGTRNTPVITDRLFSALQGWGGENASLLSQSLSPISAPHEMNLPITEALIRLNNDAGYQAQFQAVFGQAATADNLALALASFQVLQFSGMNAVDEFNQGDRGALGSAAQRGKVLFEGKARCVGCHIGVNYSDESFRNNGLFSDFASRADKGRFQKTARVRDVGLFKVPTLRNVAITAPYMHDGSFATLREVVEGYNEVSTAVSQLSDTDIRPLQLSNDEVDDLVAFLEALCSGASCDNPPAALPPTSQPPTSQPPTSQPPASQPPSSQPPSQLPPPIPGLQPAPGLLPNPEPEPQPQPELTPAPTSDTAREVCRINSETADNSVTWNYRNTLRFSAGDGRILTSANGLFALYYQGDGNLVLRNTETRQSVWSSGTHGAGENGDLSLQRDGNLVIYPRSGRALWSTATVGARPDYVMVTDIGAFIMVEDEEIIWSAGNLADCDNLPPASLPVQETDPQPEPVLEVNLAQCLVNDVTSENAVTWNYNATRRFSAGEGRIMTSANGEYILFYQGDGNLVLRDDATRSAIWSSGTHGEGENGDLSLQRDGNLVMYPRSGRAIWRTATAGSRPDFMMITDAGAFIVVEAGEIIWSAGLVNACTDIEVAPEEDGEIVTAQVPEQDDDADSDVPSSGISIVSASSDRSGSGANIRMARPEGIQAGDLLVLSLHRTDDRLRLNLPGWTRAAECLKQDNRYQCFTAEDCVDEEGDYCETFRNRGVSSQDRGARDLAQAVFYRFANNNEPENFAFPMASGAPGWAVVSVLRGVDQVSPIRAWSHRGCDAQPGTRFPEVTAAEGDWLLLTSSNDDAVSLSNFLPPEGMSLVGALSEDDEAGFVYAGPVTPAILGADGQTIALDTQGRGVGEDRDPCKDLGLSLSIKAQR